MMKKFLIWTLAVLMAAALLTGCVLSADEKPENGDAQANQFDFGTLPTVGINWDAMNGEDEQTPADMPEEYVSVSVDKYVVNTTANVIANDADPVRYVMIYNPSVYDERYPYLDMGRSTGNLGMQVEVDLNRGGLDEPVTYMGADQGQLNENVPFDELGGEGSRANAMIEPYRVGDTEIFYCYDTVSLSNPRIARTFTCRYAGTSCNIWVADCDISDAIVNDYGSQFDTYIYPNVTQTFGQPRFSQYGGKVNLLYYPMPDGYGGCFSFWDLYAFDEVTLSDITTYGLNTDLDILHINGNYTVYEQMQTFMRSTMAHEFQHLICATNAFETLNMEICPVWINEAMSGYIEEQLYPGVKNDPNSGHLEAFRQGEYVRNGQSMYNFNSTTTDFGVYGSVYLYAEYAANLAGDDVFSKFHRYWRASYSPTLSGAEALSEAFPLPVHAAVDESITYPSTLVFDNEYEEWMSKLTLQFYLELLSKDDTDPEAFSLVDGRDLLYNQINATTIEGGGRIIVALQGDSYTIPSDADTGLIYVGLNGNFEPVTELVFR